MQRQVGRRFDIIDRNNQPIARRKHSAWIFRRYPICGSGREEKNEPWNEGEPEERPPKHPEKDPQQPGGQKTDYALKIEPALKPGESPVCD